MIRRFLLLLVFVACAVGVTAGTASAHNSLESTNPSDGAILEESPPQITWVFTNDVPLDTLTITLVDAAGVRSTITGSAHGPGGTREVVTPLPVLPAGATTLRWRLVGPDGHPVTGRVVFTVNAPPATTAAAEVASTTPSSTPAPTTVVEEATVTTVRSPVATSSADSFDGDWSTPSGLRWLLRALSYLAIMLVAGVFMTQTFVWRDNDWDRYRQLLRPALGATAVLAVLQLLVVASDISARPMWLALGSIDAALDTYAGVAFLLRVVIAVIAWLLIVHAPPRTPDVRANVLVLLSLALLGTWSFAGHSRTMRWPALGVPVDIIHHGAAAAWLGGLTILGLVAIPRLRPEELAPLMRRFSTTAEIAVALIVGTGVVQAVRLVGSPGDLFAANHGKLLVVKLAVLGGMLWAANANRTRVNTTLRSAGAAVRPDADGLRRAMVIEFLIGLVIIGVTAAMVVSPPASTPSTLPAPVPVTDDARMLHPHSYNVS